MTLIFIYFPTLIFLPVLLLVGVFFLIVPGGFIIIAAAAYLVWLALTAVVAAAATAGRHAARVSRPRDRSNVTLGLPSSEARRGLPAAAPVRLAAVRPNLQSTVSEPRRAA